ncbi:Pre-mRNA-splicing factor CWC2 [Tetrabaena socialis]|uniref:Pre-mRNA-splicing factor CWC2 n=1 Tax=Tetrabaena socialis TaxID=47790 RepID=A0A2J8A3E7_9CHLO|nr:Pre-mRNA-splicing factor CWC2 [Tetrabaena socialis]|eukprot:PNH07026.1 Pre-mRNA-splicing factor CWC2 [Tetrabaena socialis]
MNPRDPYFPNREDWLRRPARRQVNPGCTLERDNRTLYVNYEGAGSYELPRIRQLIDANFRLFGPLNNVYILHLKTSAFVRFDWRSSAEFAKEAMNKQRLAGSTMGEVLTARWANEDPNPVAVMAQKRACETPGGNKAVHEALGAGVRRTAESALRTT